MKKDICNTCTTPNICRDLGKFSDCRKGAKSKKLKTTSDFKKVLNLQNNGWKLVRGFYTFQASPKRLWIYNYTLTK